LSYTKQFKRGVQRPITLQSKVFDCSGWVYFVLLNLNSTLANKIGQNTTTMKAYISSHGGLHSNPQVGDLAVWGGHVEFVVSVSGNKIEISGSNGATGGAVPKVSGTGGWLTVGSSALNNFGSGGFLGFWTIQ
jgi:surface antigen